MIDGRKRGIIFDVGHGGTSLRYSSAIPMVKAGFLPDSISTDLHTSSMNSAMKDMLNVMGKFMAMGVPFVEVIKSRRPTPHARSSWSPWATCRSVAGADVAVLRVEQARFGFVDFLGGRLEGKERLQCELTVRDGKVVYDLNGMIADPWDTLPRTPAAATRNGIARAAIELPRLSESLRHCRRPSRSQG